MVLGTRLLRVCSYSSKSLDLAKPLGETPREATKGCVLLRWSHRSETLLVTASLDPPVCVRTDIRVSVPCVRVRACTYVCVCRGDRAPACARVCGGLYLPVRLGRGAIGLTPTSIRAALGHCSIVENILID